MPHNSGTHTGDTSKTQVAPNLDLYNERPITKLRTKSWAIKKQISAVHGASYKRKQFLSL